MAERSVGAQNRSSPFIYHVRENEFHFHSIEYSTKGDRFKLETPVFAFLQAKERNIEKQRELDKLTIIDAYFTVRNKFFLAIGGSGMSAGGFDFQKGYIIKNKTGEEVFQENEQLATTLPATKEEMDSAGRYKYTGLQDIDNVEAFLKNQISFPLQNMVEVELLLRGKANRKSMKIMEFQSMGGVLRDEKYNGIWFIKKAFHTIRNGEYYNKLHLIKPGYEDGPTTTGLVKTRRGRV